VNDVARNKDFNPKKVAKSPLHVTIIFIPKKIVMLTKPRELPKLQCPHLTFPLSHRAIRRYTVSNATTHHVQVRSPRRATAHPELPNTARLQLFTALSKHSSAGAEIEELEE
jgi:hypothetical protein